MTSPRFSQIRPEGTAGQYPKVNATADGWDYDVPAGSGSDPTTTKGDIPVRSATALDRLPVGTDGYTPIADSTQTLGVRWGMGYPSPKHERLTASGGETTLTLGAAPIGDGPILWDNGALIWPTTDYTISGQTVTFTSALVAGHVISVYYLAAGTAPPPSSLGGVAALPTDYAGLQLWLRPEAITGLSNLDPVSTWADSSTAANDMTSAATSRPTWASAPFVDGKGGVRFDGANRYMQLASTATLDLTGDFALFVVVRLNTVNKGSTSQNTILSKDYTRYEMLEYQSTEAMYVGSGIAQSASSVLAASSVYLLEAHRASSALTVVKNAVQTASTTNSASATGTYALTLGGRPSALTTANALIGDVFEVLVYDQARSSTEKTSLRNYVAARWPSIGL